MCRRLVEAHLLKTGSTQFSVQLLHLKPRLGVQIDLTRLKHLAYQVNWHRARFELECCVIISQRAGNSTRCQREKLLHWHQFIRVTRKWNIFEPQRQSQPWKWLICEFLCKMVDNRRLSLLESRSIWVFYCQHRNRDRYRNLHPDECIQNISWSNLHTDSM